MDTIVALLPENVTLFALVACATAFLFAGFIDSIAGGGGLITVPSLLLTGLPPHIALGSGKFATMLGSLSAMVTYLRGHYIVMKAIPVGFAAAFVGSAFGAWLALQVSSEVLGKLLVFLMPVGAVSLFVKKDSTIKDELTQSHFQLKVFFIAFLIGTYDGFFGPGAGTFLIICFNLILRMDLVRASGTAKFINLASNFGALCTFASGGAVSMVVAVPCAIASIIGNHLGAKYAIKVGPTAVRKFLYLALALLLGTLVYRFFIQ